MEIGSAIEIIMLFIIWLIKGKVSKLLYVGQDIWTRDQFSQIYKLEQTIESVHVNYQIKQNGKHILTK